MAINPRYIWGISQKDDGQMKVYPDTVESVLLNRKIFFDKVCLNADKIVSADLVHGDNVGIVGDGDIGRKIKNTDGLITSTPNVILTITVADCLPVYFFDDKKKAIGLAHAGWRGVAKNIASKMIKNMQSEFGTNPRDMIVNIGPHIKDCHFDIKEDLIKQFEDYKNYMIKDGDKTRLDLSAIVIEQLKNEGVMVENIDISDDCTYCLDKKYFSFRRDRPERVEAMAAYAVIKR